mgnify:CR=1 FL=1
MKIEFKKTVKLIKEYKENLSLRHNSLAMSVEELAFFDPEQDSFVIKSLTKIRKAFKSEYKAFNTNNEYFYGCKASTYSATFENRLKSYLESDLDKTKLTFIKDELNTGVLEHDYYYIDDSTSENIRYSLLARIEFLKDETVKLGYILNISASGDKWSFEKTSTSIVNNKPLDLSSENASKKIIYLQELGIIDFLRSFTQPAPNNNQIASILSAITGIKASTIQSYINPIGNEYVSQKNNPYNNTNNVEEVKNKIISSGFFN